jgi:hypothetical protein
VQQISDKLSKEVSESGGDHDLKVLTTSLISCRQTRTEAASAVFRGCGRKTRFSRYTAKNSANPGPYPKNRIPRKYFFTILAVFPLPYNFRNKIILVSYPRKSDFAKIIFPDFLFAKTQIFAKKC